MARTSLARRIARLTPLVAAAAALAAPAAASAQSSYPTGDGLLTTSFDDGVVSVWPDGTNSDDMLIHGVVGTFDGSGNYLSLKTGNSIASMFNMNTRVVNANVGYDFGAIGATAMSPSGSTLGAIIGSSLGTYAGPGIWNQDDFAVGRFGWATKAGNQRKVYIAGPGAVNGGGQDIAGSVAVLEQDNSKWVAVSGAGAMNATVSPDGRWIAYEVTTDGQRDVYAFDTTVDGSPFMVADQTTADEYLPTFSPDSTRLVFAREVGSSTELREIPVTQVAASRLVASFAVAPATGLAWQPSVRPTAGTLEINTVDSPRVGEPVSWVGNANSGYKPMTDTITWQRCPALGPAADGDGCVDITTGEAYQPVGADVGYRLRIRREVKNPAGSSTIYSDKTALVVGLPAGKPTFTKTPGELTTDSYSEFAWTGEGDNPTFQCRVTEGLGVAVADTGWQPCTSPAQTPSLTSGQYRFLVRQGADGAIASHAFTVDQDPPATPELVMQKVDGLSASVTFTGGSSEPVTFECSLDAGPWTPCPGAWSGKDLAEGKHRLEIRAIDEAGNHSATAVATWTNTKPAEPVKPVEPVEPVKPVEPVVEEPKSPVTKVPPKAPALTGTIGGTRTGAQGGANGPTSSAATIEVAKESVGVGCAITGTVLKSCKVDLYADVASGTAARAAAAKQVLVGTGTYESKNGSAKMDVRIELNATGKAMLRKNPDGLKVAVKITGNPVSGPPLKVTGVAKLVTDRASLTVGGFAVNSAVLTSKAKAQLRVLAKFGKAASLRCVGHTDGSSDDAKYLTSLGARRAKVVCTYLSKHGVKASSRTLVSKADTVPAATNTTGAGRATNRRVHVSLVR